MLTRNFSVAGMLNGLLALAVLFPFVPRLLQSTDTQPTFLALFAALVVVAFVSPGTGRNALRITLPGLTLGVLVTLTLYAILLGASVGQPRPTILSRVISFAQFGLAALWAHSSRFEWSGRLLYRALAVYAGFTVLYFVTGGALEDVLMQSRVERAESLFAGGRGARTLSPEPSFFALQMFTIFVLARLTGIDRAMARMRWLGFVALCVFCLAASLSAFGALLGIVVLAVTFPRWSAVAAAATVAFFGALAPLLSNWESVRAVRVLLAIVKSGGSIAGLVLLDASMASRLNSFAAYVREFTEYPLLGNAFSLWEGGGFVSIVAGFGVVGLLFFIAVLLTILFGRFRPGTKVALLAWFSVNFISGPIGMPIVGVMIGTLFRQVASQRHSRRAIAPTNVPLAMST